MTKDWVVKTAKLCEDVDRFGVLLTDPTNPEAQLKEALLHNACIAPALAARLRVLMKVWPSISELNAARLALDYNLAHLHPPQIEAPSAEQLQQARDEADRLVHQANRRCWSALYYLAGTIAAATAELEKIP